MTPRIDRAQLDGRQLSDLQTAAGARIRKKPQRLEAELSAEPSFKRAKRNTPKPTTEALKRSEETNERLKVKLKDAHAKIKYVAKPVLFFRKLPSPCVDANGSSEHNMCAPSNRALEGQVKQLQGQVVEQERLLKLTSSKASDAAIRCNDETREGMDCAPDPRLVITATRSQPALGGIQGMSKTLSVTPTDQYDIIEDRFGKRCETVSPMDVSHSGETILQRWQPDAIALAIRQWWQTLEERLQNALDADDLGVYPSRESRGIGEEQTGAEWWATFSSYSENDLKDMFYKEGTVLHDGQRCGKDEVKLKMKDRKM